MATDMHATYIYGGTGGTGGAGGQSGGSGGVGQGNSIQIHATSVHVHDIQSEDYHKIMDFISPINFLPRQQEIYKTRHEATGNWFLGHPAFLEWKSGSAQLLWCFGIPGAGKTVLASLIFNHLKMQESSNIGVACAFLNYKESITQTLENILGAILRQLAFEHDLEPVRLLYRKHSKQGTAITVDEIQGLLKIYTHQFDQVYVIIDALDEYSADNKDQLLNMLLATTHKTKLLITSRPHLTPLEDMQTLKIGIHPPDEDLESYIVTQISQSRRLQKFAQDPSVQKEIIQSIIKKTAGMFLFAKLQMELLSLALTKATLLQTLRNLPATLQALYLRTLEHIKLEKPELRDIGLTALAWIAFAKRPLRVAELRAALAIPVTKPFMPDETSMVQVDDILQAAHGLLIVNQQKGGDIVRLVHHSAQEFMDTIQCQEFPAIHTDITRTLLVCLNWALNSGDFPRNHYRRSDHFDSEAHPLLAYSQYLLTHIKGEDTEMKLKSDLCKDINSIKKYPHWDIEPWSTDMVPHPVSLLWLAVAGNLLYLLADLLKDRNQLQQASNLLTVAARYGHLSVLEMMATAHIVVKTEEWDLALQQAALGGHRQTLEYLLSMGADVNTKTISGTALQAAAVQGHQEIIKLLLQAGANPNFLDEDDGTALQSAAANGHLEIVQLLVQALANPNLVGGFFGTSLQAAACEGHSEIVQLLLQANADPNLLGGHYRTALYAAATGGHDEIVQLLLHAHADPNNMDKEHLTALQSAAYDGYQEIVTSLLQANADPNTTNGRSPPLCIAAENGHIAIVELLLEANADPNLKWVTMVNEGQQVYPLYLAAEQGHYEIVELLLQFNAATDMIGGKYGTAINVAALNGHQEIVELLLQANASPNVEGDEAGNALYIAAWKGFLEIVELLLQAHADLNIIGGYGTPLYVASYTGNVDIAQLFLEHGADVNLTGGYYGTALQAAARIGHQVIVELLLQYNANPNLMSGHHGTALRAAFVKGHDEIVDDLLQAGADPDLAADYDESESEPSLNLDWHDSEPEMPVGQTELLTSNHDLPVDKVKVSRLKHISAALKSPIKALVNKIKDKK